jgi:hypothetical protein
MWVCLKGVFGSMCGNQIITEQLSPDKKYKFIVFVRDCGATTGFSTQVSILRNDKKLRDDDSGNVLTISDHYYGDWYNKYGGADVKAEWTTNKKILIRFDNRAETRTKENEVKGIEIVYDEIR